MLRQRPELGKADAGGGDTPLMYLPGDDAEAAEIVELFLAAGADPTIKNREGLTAGDLADKRGLEAAAALLRAR